MKKLPVVLCVLLMATVANAATITFEWDPAPAGESWAEVRLYEDVAGEAVLKTTVPGDQTTATLEGVTPGEHTYFARSFGGLWESANSNTVTTPALPGAPINFRVTVTVQVDVK